MSRLPTYETCQPPEGEEPDPREIFQWVFVQLPYVGSTPLIISPQVRPEWSKLFWELGFRHHPELQKKKIRVPHRGQQHALNGSVQIVDIDDPDPDPVVLPNMAEFTPHEQAVIAEQLRYSGAIQGESTARATAKVLDGPPFDPAQNTVSAVNGYLTAMNAMGQETEMRRVVAAEMTGKKRDGILRKWRAF
ncbi:hypothetical protein JOJ87_001421 [Rhodococcus ruber]|uniref:phage gene 29 protein family protein n=1 Tax=Rhodococcus ruber TaxID=1830 RepID=UPI001AE86670|nr:DUF2744 domain-containing protein [Rhodococcus ruber]MBP2211077.1 hypothetical protein [Rhodococcus ruber]